MIVKELEGSPALLTGEGPHWMEKDQSLVYVDIPGGYIFRYFLETGRLQRFTPDNPELGKHVSLVVPLQGSNDEFVISIGKTLCLIKWSPDDSDHVIRQATPIVGVDDGQANRFNDGKCDPRGRLWAGTMAYETSPGVVPLHKGSLYSVNPSLSASKHFDKVSISNGLAWSSDRKKFFYIDSLNYQVEVFDYDDSACRISNRKVVYDYKKDGRDSTPDGMAIDVNDNLWVACYQGSEVICVDTNTGRVASNVKLPSYKITSCCFGGQDYSTLFVTSSCFGLTRSEFDSMSGTGKTLQVQGLGVKGLPANGFVVDKKSSNFPSDF